MWKKHLTIISGLMIIILFQSCAMLLGIKSPSPISKETAIDYLISHKIDTANVLFLKENYIDTLRTYPFKPNWEAGLRPIQFKIFNSKGVLVFQYSTCEGFLKGTNFFEQFPPENITPIDSTYTVYDELHLIENFGFEKRDDRYTTIIYWATYTGIPGRKLIKEVERQYELKNIESTIYKLNVDIIQKE